MFAFIFNSATFTVSVAFPVFASYKALQSSNPASIKPWLTYWLTFTVISTADFVLSPLYSWIPLYSLFKLYFFIWLVLPQTKGYSMVYHAYLLPVLQRYDPLIQSTINEWQSSHWLSDSADRAYSLLVHRYFALKNRSSPESQTDIPLSTLLYENAKDTMLSTLPAFWAASPEFPSQPDTASHLARFENSYTSVLLDQFKEPKNPGDSLNSVTTDSSSATSWGYSILSSLTFSTLPKLADTINGKFANDSQTQEVSQTSSFPAAAATYTPGSSTELLGVAKNDRDSSKNDREPSKNDREPSKNDKDSSQIASGNQVKSNRMFSWIFRKQSPQQPLVPHRTLSSPLPVSNQKHQQKENNVSECSFVYPDDNVKLSYKEGIIDKRNDPPSNGYSNFGWVNVTKEKIA